MVKSEEENVAAELRLGESREAFGCETERDAHSQGHASLASP